MVEWPRRPRMSPLLAPVAVLAAVAAATAYVAAIDPNEPGHYPTCPFLYVTGYYCPGCGSLRMIHALAHGHVSDGAGSNPLAFAMIPVLGYVWLRWIVCARHRRPLRSHLFHPWAIGVFAAVLIAYCVVRNLPFGHALAP